MHTNLIIDDRENASHMFRDKRDRRVNKIQFHLLKSPFIDSNGYRVSKDRRSEHDRRYS